MSVFSSMVSAFAFPDRGLSRLMGIFSFLPLFFISSLIVSAQGSSSSVSPRYEWRGHENLTNISVSPFPPYANTDDLTISMDTDPLGNIYTLTFGAGIIKRNPDGSIEEANFIPENELDNPLDFAIDEAGYIYVADYLDYGEFFDNGKIKVFSPEGKHVRDILTSFYRPLGVAVDKGKVYVAEYNAPGSGTESTEMSRIRIYDKISGTPVLSTEEVQIPFRIAVNTKGQVFVSHAGDEVPEVLYFDKYLTLEGRLPNIISPGSVVVDKFDFVHVTEYKERIKFRDFLNFQSMEGWELIGIAFEILSGIENEEFEIKIFNSAKEQVGSVKEEIDFPLDMAFNNCDKMYVNNVNILMETSTLDFDIEIYGRTPSLDTELPVALCVPPGQEFKLVSGEVTISIDEINNGSSDNCGIESMTVSPDTFTTAGIHQVTLTVKDFAGNENTCATSINILEPVVELQIDCPDESLVLELDENCHYIMPDLTYLAESVPGAVISQIPGEGDIIKEDTEVELTATLNGVSVWCKFQLDLVDNAGPEVICPEDVEVTFHPASGFVIPDYTSLAQATDNCGGISITQIPAKGTVVHNNTPIQLILSDSSNNSSVCEFMLFLKEEKVPSFECPDPDALPPLELNAECTIEIPNYKGLLTTNDGYQNEPFFVQTEVKESDILKISIEVYDGEGGPLVGECKFQIQLLDSTLPIIDCPNSPLSISPDVNGKYIMPDLSELASDACDRELKIIQDPPPGEISSGGTVSIQAIDNSGNASEICQFEVILLEEEEPEPISCVTTITLPLDVNGEAQLDVMQLYEGDLGPEGIATVNKEFFTCNDLGEQSVTFVYSGISSDSCNIRVTVVDKIAPIPRARNIEIFLDDDGAASISPEDLNNGSSDNCGEADLQFAVDKTNFSCSDLGANTVTFSVIDSSGNTSNIDVSVKVKDPQNHCAVDTEVPPEERFVILFPNPSRGQVQISTSLDISLQRLEIFDFRGRFTDAREMIIDPVTKTYHLDLQKYQTGIYTLKLYTGQRVYIRRAIITTF